MRHIVVLMSLGLLACRSAPPGDGAPNGAGTTTYTRGTPVARSETTRTGAPRQGAGGATLTLDRSAYAAGGEVTMRITSQSSDTLGYNPCSNRSVERQQGERWVVHPEPDRVCTMEIRFLLPGQTATARTNLPADLGAGTYRIALTLRPENGSAPVRAVSPEFSVE